jgi:hypothetical protein
MFNTLDTKKTTALSIVRSGWLSPEYTLTDDAYNYGTMRYFGLSRRKATVKTASTNWVLNWAGPFTRTVSIKDETGASVGQVKHKWFSRRVILTMQTGFQAEFYHSSLFSREFTWESDGCGKIMHISSNPLSTKDNVNIDNCLAPPAIIPLLIFLGEHLIILRRRRKAAH